MFASRIVASAPENGELHAAAMETFDLLLDVLEAPAVGFLRERAALKIWALLHGVVMLAQQGLWICEVAHANRELVEDMIEQAKLTVPRTTKARRKKTRPLRR